MNGLVVWVLTGERTGDNNQVLALADALELPFEVKRLDYNALQPLSVWLPPTVVTLTRAARLGLKPPWPDLVITIGRRSVPAAGWIKRQNSGRTKLVHIGHPRIDPGLFDLVITTRQYPVPPGDNVVLLPAAMSRYPDPPAPTEEEVAWLAVLPRPYRLMAIGGATKYWKLSPRLVAQAIDRLRAKAGGSLIVVSSRRTDPAVMAAAKEATTTIDDSRMVTGGFPRFAMLLGQADEIHVTGDSVSMLSEAILSGKPVGLIPIEQSSKGRRKLGPHPQVEGRDAGRRDLRRFWQYLQEQELIGTVDHPSAGHIDSPNMIAAMAVKALLED